MSGQPNPEIDSAAYQKQYQDVLVRSRNNDSPKSLSERKELHALIEDTRLNLERCINETDRVWLAKALELQESLLSPIRTLPREIMCFIFSLMRRGRSPGIKLTAGDYDGQFQCRTWIFELTWICSTWREIIFSDSSFWSFFDLRGRVDVSSSRSSGFGHMQTCLKELLRHSGATASLSLNMSFRGQSSKDTSGLFPILDTLAENAIRWRHAKLCFTWSKYHLTHLLQQVHSRMTILPTLEVLEIESDHHSFEPGFYGTTFSQCPRLHTLTLPSYRPTDLLDLRHLTTLKVYTYIGHSFAALLQNCPLLETFELNRSIPSPDSFEPEVSTSPSPITINHPNLTKLEILDITECSPIGFWRHVSLPKLIHVRALMIGVEPIRIRFEELRTMLVTSQCVLQHVDFIWYKNTLSDSLESLVQGISINSQARTHFISESNGTHRRVFAVQSR